MGIEYLLKHKMFLINENIYHINFKLYIKNMYNIFDVYQFGLFSGPGLLNQVHAKFRYKLKDIYTCTPRSGRTQWPDLDIGKKKLFSTLIGHSGHPAEHDRIQLPALRRVANRKKAFLIP